VFLATGKHDLRGAPRPGRTGGPIGLKTYYGLDRDRTAALRGHVELILFHGGYAGLQLVEADQAVLCVLVSRPRLRASGGDWGALLGSLLEEAPHLADRLAGARPLRERPATVAGLPYGYRHAPAADAPAGLYHVGDQATVIASLTGDGVALALATASLAARSWLEAGDAAAYHRRLDALVSRQMRTASALHRLCLTPLLQPWIVHACRVWPAIMQAGASLTRTRLPTV
jgi:hypothetical protein